MAQARAAVRFGANVEASAATGVGMDCPECGGRLVDYRLGDRGAVGCEDCGYVGIDAEHRGRPTERESWDDALERFYRRRTAPATDDRTAGADAAGREEPGDGDDPHDDDVATDEEPTDGDVATDGTEDGEPPDGGIDRARPAAVNGSVDRTTDDDA